MKNYRFLDGKSNIDKTSTIGLPHYYCNFRLSDGSCINVEIMDTAGQERFKSINRTYCKKADCCLLVYDISERNTFIECQTYFNELIKKECSKNVQVIVLGNKTDLEEKRKVSTDEGIKFSEENNYIFMETSCLKNEKVSDAFSTLIEKTYREAIKNNTIKIRRGIKHKKKIFSSC